MAHFFKKKLFRFGISTFYPNLYKQPLSGTVIGTGKRLAGTIVTVEAISQIHAWTSGQRGYIGITGLDLPVSLINWYLLRKGWRLSVHFRLGFVRFQLRRDCRNLIGRLFRLLRAFSYFFPEPRTTGRPCSSFDPSPSWPWSWAKQWNGIKEYFRTRKPNMIAQCRGQLR